MDACRLKQTIFGIFIVDNIGALDFIESVLQEITQVHLGAFCVDAGRYDSRNLWVGTGDVYQALAYRIFIQETVAQLGEPQRNDQKRPQPSQ